MVGQMSDTGRSGMTTLKRGFTLIELLVVIAIIGLLSSVVLASLSTSRQKSRDARRVSDIDQLRTALELYFDASTTYPTFASTTAGWPQVVVFGQTSVATGLGYLQSTYMSRVPTPQSSGYNYFYCPMASASTTVGCDGSVSATTYVIAAYLERSDSPALKNDTEKVVRIGGTTVFDGSGVCTTSGTDQCFDITP